MPNNQGTGFTNLQQYLTANQGNKLGDTLSNGIQGVTDKANTNLNSQVNDFNQGLQAENSKINGGFNQANQNVSTLNSNPTGFDTSDLSQVQGFNSSQYGGPTALKDQNSLDAQGQNISNIGQLAGSSAGRSQLLRQFVNAPNYTNTGQNFDSLFLGNNIDSQLRGSKQAANQFGNDVTQQEQAAQFKSGATKNQLGSDQTDINNQIGTIGSNLTNVLNSRLSNAQKQDTAFNNDIQNQNLQALADAGYTIPQGTQNNLATANYYGLGNQYFNTLATPTYSQNESLAGLANDNDRAQAAALAQLTNNSSYNDYTTGNKYVAPTLTINQQAANPILQTEYNKLLNSGLGTLASQYSTNGTSPYAALNSTVNQLNNLYAATGQQGGRYGDSSNTLASYLNMSPLSNVPGSGNQTTTFNNDISSLRSFLQNQFGQVNGTQGATSTGTTPTGYTGTPVAGATSPTSPVGFQGSPGIYQDSSTGQAWIYNGSNWTLKG